MNLYLWYLTILTVLGLAGCLLFIGGYWWVTKGGWIREEPGQFMMTYTGSVAGLLTIILLNQWLGDWGLRRPVTAVVSLAFVGSLWWPLRLLWLAQRERSKR